MAELNFEEAIQHEVKKAIIANIQKHEFVSNNWSSRRELPKTFIDKIWVNVDWDSVLEKVKPQIETQICNAVIGNIQTEIKTDVKNILSIDGVRQKLRVHVYPELMKVLNNEI